MHQLVVTVPWLTPVGDSYSEERLLLIALRFPDTNDFHFSSKQKYRLYCILELKGKRGFQVLSNRGFIAN